MKTKEADTVEEFVLINFKDNHLALRDYTKHWLIQKIYYLKWDITVLRREKRALAKELTKKWQSEVNALKNKYTKDITKRDDIIKKLRARLTVWNDKAFNHTRLAKEFRIKYYQAKNDLEDLQKRASPYRTIEQENLLSYLLTYVRLEKEGYVTFNELMILATAATMEAFTAAGLKQACNFPKQYPQADFRLLVNGGFIKRIGKRDLYHLSVKGHDRLNDLLTYIKEKDIEFYHGKYEIKRGYVPIVNN